MTVSTLIIIAIALLAIVGGITTSYFNRAADAALICVGTIVLGIFALLLALPILQQHQIQLDMDAITLGAILTGAALVVSTVVSFAGFELRTRSQRTATNRPGVIHKY